MKRTKIVVYVTPDEKAILSREAAAKNRTLSNFLKYAGLTEVSRHGRTRKPKTAKDGFPASDGGK